MANAHRTAEQGKVRVLLIEDDVDDYLLTRDLLADIPDAPYLLDRAADYASGSSMLFQGQYEVCLLDYRLGARNGIELLQELKAKGLHPAVIMLTGQHDRELDLAAMNAGATDFLEKGSLTVPVLERSLRYALQQKRNADQLEERVASRTAELHASEERQRRIAEDLSEAGKRKDEFMAMLAHELRNPLASLHNGILALLLDPEKVDEVSSIARMLERQVGQMTHLVDDLLDVSRITRGKIELRLEHIDLASIIAQATEAVKIQMDDMAHTFNVTLPERNIHLDADPVRLSQVIINLLNNACKFTPKGGRISLLVEQENEQALLLVKDNGIGIEVKDQTSIFEIFLQLDSSLERLTSGLGLGLPLVNKLVQLHGGSVEVFSEGTGRGSEFAVRIPIQAHVPLRAPTQEAQLSNTVRRILIVDDNRDGATMLSLLLKKMGNETHLAYDGLEGVKVAEQLKPDTIIMDIGLPGLNGYEACRRIREQPWGAHINIIALTGWGQAEDRKRSEEAGFDAHLVKPVDKAQLLTLLSEKNV